MAYREIGMWEFTRLFAGLLGWWEGRASRVPAVGARPGRRGGIAMCESFEATLECELLDRKRFRRQAEARMAVFDFIEGRYNSHRRQSSLDYASPIEYERKNAARGRDPNASLPTEGGELQQA
jgi:transposase InsO family protein